MQDTGRVGCATAGASLFAALSVTIGLWAAPAWLFAWAIWIVTFAAALLLGLPLYALTTRFGRLNGWTAAVGGALAALAPAS